MEDSEGCAWWLFLVPVHESEPEGDSMLKRCCLVEAEDVGCTARSNSSTSMNTSLPPNRKDLGQTDSYINPRPLLSFPLLSFPNKTNSATKHDSSILGKLNVPIIKSKGAVGTHFSRLWNIVGVLS